MNDIFFNDTATTEIYALSLHDALPIFNVAICVFRGEQRVVSMGQEWVDSPMQPWVATVIILVAIGLIMAIAQGRLDWMQWRWLTYAGALTYPFYLLLQMIG